MSVDHEVLAVLQSVGANVALLRRRQGLTQERLAELVGIDLRFLQRVERGKTNVGVVVVARLAAALEVPVQRLFRHRSLPPAELGRPRRRGARKST